MKSFRYKKGIRVPYEWQGMIYFQARLYDELDAATRKRIRETAGRAGGEYTTALLEYITTAGTAEEVSARYYLSPETLMRAAERYYLLMYKYMVKKERK